MCADGMPSIFRTAHGVSCRFEHAMGHCSSQAFRAVMATGSLLLFPFPFGSLRCPPTHPGRDAPLLLKMKGAMLSRQTQHYQRVRFSIARAVESLEGREGTRAIAAPPSVLPSSIRCRVMFVQRFVADSVWLHPSHKAASAERGNLPAPRN